MDCIGCIGSVVGSVVGCMGCIGSVVGCMGCIGSVVGCMGCAIFFSIASRFTFCCCNNHMHSLSNTLSVFM
jgi:hypothetical protein